MKGTLLALCLLAWAGGAAADDRETVEKARLAQYSLQREGLASFQCRLLVDWEFLLADLLKADPVTGKSALAELGRIQFSVAYRIGVPAKITHNSPTPSNPEQGKAFQNIYTGMDEMMGGFFQTWSPFMATSSMPPPGNRFTLVERSGQWELSFPEADTTVDIVLDRDFAIRSVTATKPDFRGVVQPQFTRSARGYLLTAFRGETRGKTPGDSAIAEVELDYQDVGGLQLPKKLFISGSADGGGSFKAKLSFAECRATRR